MRESSTDKRTRNHAGTSTHILLCTVLACVALLAGFMLPRGQSTPPALVSTIKEGVTKAQKTVFDDSRTVTLNVSKGVQTKIASAVTGTVTANSCSSDGLLESGKSALSIDSKPQLMLHTSTPPWRDLSSGTRGDDAAALNTELRRLGGGAPDTDTVTWRTLVAFDRIAHEAGIKNNAAAARGSVTRDMFIWLPSTTAKASQCNATTGQQVTQGDTLFTTAANVASAVPASLPPDLAQGSRSIQIGDKQLDVNPDGTGFDSAELLSAIQTSGEYLAADRQSNDSGSTGTVAATLSVSYTWKLKSPVEAFAIPPSAIYDQQAMSACVISDGKPSKVDVIASRLGRTLVTTEDKLGQITIVPEEPEPCQ
ncbi:hypothetical protein [Bifidobacterium vespertilionis]|uniref:Peptidoglycan-binding protein n=1 Tax=Bifidobacterium vespertilionis TaxID=2562524 RepID=A0A5J5DVH5_9BIFI|nr:hypothetical protein [Bifidobacterium vespertilionis]KAA8820179.1 hypothetical protein EMO90_07035 [Bifidobacterium vespertilionis]KAA8823896.1 hypothetical protein EM848_03615 [Bifidobacterium vespertilionis]